MKWNCMWLLMASSN